MYPGISQFCRRKQRKQSMRNEAIHQKRDLILCFPFSTKSGTGSRESGLWRNEPCTLQRSSKTVISRRHCCTPFSMKSVRGSKDYSRWRNEVCVAWSNPKQRDQSARGFVSHKTGQKKQRVSGRTEPAYNPQPLILLKRYKFLLVFVVVVFLYSAPSSGVY